MRIKVIVLLVIDLKGVQEEVVFCTVWIGLTQVYLSSSPLNLGILHQLILCIKECCLTLTIIIGMEALAYFCCQPLCWNINKLSFVGNTWITQTCKSAKSDLLYSCCLPQTRIVYEIYLEKEPIVSSLLWGQLNLRWRLGAFATRLSRPVMIFGCLV